MTQIPPKEQIKSELLEALHRQLELLEKTVDVAKDATTHADAKSEGKYDTRAIESGYLAGAQANRVKELKGKIAYVQKLSFRTFDEEEAIDNTSLVKLGEKWLLLIQHAGGFIIECGVLTITTISPETKLGAEIKGAFLGDDIGDLEITEHH